MLQTETIDSILGTPSSQKILRLLYCWGQLSVKELISKTNLSESQIYNTLRSLESVNLVETVNRGLYSYTKNTFSMKLKEAYVSHLIQIIGKELHYLSSNIDKEDWKTIDERFTNLVTLWKPLLESNYPLKTSSLAGHILERFN